MRLRQEQIKKYGSSRDINDFDVEFAFINLVGPMKDRCIKNSAIIESSRRALVALKNRYSNQWKRQGVDGNDITFVVDTAYAITFHSSCVLE